MTQADWTQYQPFWQKRGQTRPTPEMNAVIQAGRQEAQHLSQLLASEFGVKRVYLFGSFAWGTEIRADSDLDLAVEGLPLGQLVFAHAWLSNLSPYRIDLVLLNQIPDRLHKLILKFGIICVHPCSSASKSI